MYESYTDSFKLGRVKESIELLKQLSLMSNDNSIRKDKELTQIYIELKRELHSIVRPEPIRLVFTPAVWKILALIFPWFSISLIIVPDVLRGKLGWGGVVGGIAVLAFPFILIGIFLPFFENRWINYWLYPWGTCALAIGGIMLWQRIKKRQN